MVYHVGMELTIENKLMFNIISYLAPTMILLRRLLHYHIHFYSSNQTPNTPPNIKSREELARTLHLKLRIMNFKRLGYKRLTIMTNRDMVNRHTKWSRNYRWRELTKEKLRLNKELLELRIKTKNARSEKKFSSIIDKFCSTTDFLELHHMQNMFENVTSTTGLSSYRSTIQNARLNLASLGYYVSTDHCIQRNVHTDCIFLAERDPDMPIVIDTGASVSLTPNKNDFISFEARESSVHGIGAVSKVQGVGTVRWQIYDLNNHKHTIETRALYMPEAGIRLYSPQTHFQENTDGTMHITHDKVRLQFPNTSSPLIFPFQQGNNLPLMLPLNRQANASYLPFTFSHHITAQTMENSSMNHTSLQLLPETTPDNILNAITDERNANLTSGQKELLAWHYRWGHMSMHTLQRLLHPTRELDNMDSGESLSHPTVIRTSFKTTHTCIIPQCAACNLAKQARTPIRTKSTPSSTDGSLKKNDVYPGRTVSMDQFVVPYKGRTINNSASTIVGGTIFVDHCYGRIFVHHQTDLGAASTLVGKQLLERDAHHLGIKLQHFVSDNGVFTSTLFRDDLDRKNQSLHLSGVGAHHQNGVAERSIKTVTALARAMLIHSALTWPDANDISLWPFCIQHAAFIYNNTPGRDGLCPDERWSGSKSSYDHMRSLHPWGCPAYVLHPTLQDGKKLPKWTPRSRQAKFVGYSPHHASSVALMLNRRTNRISPQFHVLFDDFASTVRGVDVDAAPDLDQIDWDAFIRLHGTEQYGVPDDSSDLHPEWTDSVPLQREKDRVDIEVDSDED